MVSLNFTNKECKAIQRALVSSDEPRADAIYTRIEEALSSDAGSSGPHDTSGNDPNNYTHVPCSCGRAD